MDKWNSWYSNINNNELTSFHYGDTVTYSKGYEYLKVCNKIEDWGCGTGGFKRFFLNCSTKYIGIDGSNTPFSDIKADLVDYKSSVSGIYMRHVLEHNYNWKKILENALSSFKDRMVIVLFTPFENETKEISHNLKHGVDVPDLSFSKQDIISVFNSYNVYFTIESLNTDTGYGIEHIIYLSKHKLAYYTVFYGSDENNSNRIPNIPSTKHDCYYFTNNKNVFDQLKTTNWIGVFIDDPTSDDIIESCMKSKKIKVLPETTDQLKKYKYLCYFDTKIENVCDEIVESLINPTTIMLMRKHPDPNKNIFTELEGGLNQSRYNHEKDRYVNYIHKQILSGLSNELGYDEYHIACGFIIRNMQNSNVYEINKTWYEHIKICGIQDQISFFFVKQLFKPYIQVCEWSIL